MKLLIKDIAMFSGLETFKKGNIAIEDGLIINCGEESLDNAWKPDICIEGNKLFAMPGLINCHTHAAMVYTRSYADDVALFDWLNNHIWPLEDKLTDSDIYWGSVLAIAEMISSGTTTFADMYFSMDEVAQAVKETGMRAVLSWGLTGLNGDSAKKIENATDFALRWAGEGNGRITTMLAPHAPYTCPAPFMEKVIEKARQHNLPIHMHLAETIDEIKTIKKEYNKTPVQWANDLKLFEGKTLAAHCVHLNEADLHILKEKNVGVAYNPHSNMKLASGIAPINEMINLGIKVGIGTDGPGSNNVLDMFSEMKTGALLQKVFAGNTEVLPATTTLQMATLNGAEILNIGHEVGILKKGMKADIVIIDLDKPHLTPLANPVAHMVYCARGSDVDTTIIDGKIVYSKGEYFTLDIEKAKWEISKRLQVISS